jgi:hypothetical protein
VVDQCHEPIKHCLCWFSLQEPNLSNSPWSNSMLPFLKLLSPS